MRQLADTPPPRDKGLRLRISEQDVRLVPEAPQRQSVPEKHGGFRIRKARVNSWWRCQSRDVAQRTEPPVSTRPMWVRLLPSRPLPHLLQNPRRHGLSA